VSVLLIFGLLGAGLVAGWLLRNRSQGAAVDPGVSHVHGLGVNPRDGMLFAATHYGLFSIPPDGRATRVADRYQDTMGFTVVGDDHFLGSGHPDLQDAQLRREGKPPHLGLVESKDAGDTWKPLSLLGEADFHSISVAGGRTYAYESTGDRLMVSTDRGSTWDSRAAGIGMRSIAASPSVADRVVAVTVGGLRLSDDGGRTFESLPGAPRAVLASWAANGTLWTIDADGRLFRSDGAGSPWSERGVAPGKPQALLAAGEEVFVAVEDSERRTSIHASPDGGSSWRQRYVDSPAG